MRQLKTFMRNRKEEILWCGPCECKTTQCWRNSDVNCGCWEEKWTLKLNSKAFFTAENEVWLFANNRSTSDYISVLIDTDPETGDDRIIVDENGKYLWNVDVLKTFFEDQDAQVVYNTLFSSFLNLGILGDVEWVINSEFINLMQNVLDNPEDEEALNSLQTFLEDKAMSEYPSLIAMKFAEIFTNDIMSIDPNLLEEKIENEWNFSMTINWNIYNFGASSSSSADIFTESSQDNYEWRGEVNIETDAGTWEPLIVIHADDWYCLEKPTLPFKNVVTWFVDFWPNYEPVYIPGVCILQEYTDIRQNTIKANQTCWEFTTFLWTGNFSYYLRDIFENLDPEVLKTLFAFNDGAEDWRFVSWTFSLEAMNEINKLAGSPTLQGRDEFQAWLEEQTTPIVTYGSILPMINRAVRLGSGILNICFPMPYENDLDLLNNIYIEWDNTTYTNWVYSSPIFNLEIEWTEVNCFIKLFTSLWNECLTNIINKFTEGEYSQFPTEQYNALNNLYLNPNIENLNSAIASFQEWGNS